jgi:hypothetical protein
MPLAEFEGWTAYVVHLDAQQKKSRARKGV